MKLFAVALLALVVATPVQARGLFSFLDSDNGYEQSKAMDDANEAAYQAKVKKDLADGTDPFIHAGEPLSDAAIEMRLWKLETGFYDKPYD